MANLCGRSTASGTNGLLAASSELIFNSAGYVATGGDVTAVYLRVTDWWTADKAKVCVYNSSGSRVAVSDEFGSAQGTGWISRSLSLSLTDGARYYIGLIIDSGYIQVSQDDSGWKTGNDTSGSYASPPSSISVPGSDDMAVGLIDMYLDGTSGGGAAPASRRLLRGLGV